MQSPVLMMITRTKPSAPIVQVKDIAPVSENSDIKRPDLERKIIDQPTDAKGLFVCPSSFTAEDEVRWKKIRMNAARISSYQDSKCGSFPHTFDPTGSYVCGICNMYAHGGECVIREKPVDRPFLQSCGYWETKNAGDTELRYCPDGKLSDERIAFGSTDSSLGFGCIRCEYGQQMLPYEDSEGRPRWCAKKGMPVECEACCAENDPVGVVDKG